MTGFERRAGAIRARVALFALFALLAFAFLPLALGAQPASASPASAHWSLVVESEPTYFNAGGASDEYVVIARNDGAAAAVQGAPIQLTDTLPAGVTVRAQAPHGGRSVTATGSSADENGQPRFEMSCPEEPSGGTVTCAYENGSTQSPVLPGAMIVMTLDVSVAEGTERLEGEDTATISGGGAPTASTGTSTTVASDPAPFGLSLFTLESVQEDGEQDAQAGSHPYELTAALAFAVAERESQSPEAPLAAAAPKDVEIALPRGLIGNPRAVPRCSQKAFQEAEHEACPLDTQVGILRSFFYGQLHAQTTPVYNLVPPPGVPAELGFSVGIGRIPLFLRVRGEDEYALTASLQDIPQSGPLQGVILTLWGVPAARVHDIEREGAEGGEGAEAEVCKPKTVNEGGTIELVGCPSGAAGTPFLTLPGSCQGSPPAVGVAYDSWERPLSPLEPFTGEAPIQPALTGCGLLSFAPSLTLTPEVTQAGAPSGYTLGLHVPQNEDPGALASAELRSAVVHLPAGLVLSPAFASDLRACSPQQFDARSTAAAACPAGSQLGTAKIATPLLARELEGQVFLGTPECASCGAADAQEGRLLRVLVQAQGEGVTIKLEGSVSIDQATGQLTVSFRESPELPVEDVSLTFAGGADAPLVNPASCGVALSATAQLIPYSDDGAIAEPTSAPFTLGGCQPSVFRPAFSAATTNNQAGAFSPLVLAVGRSDAEAPLSTLSVRLVPGLMGMLSRVAPCTAQQAQAAACTSQSLIGTVAINAGAGPAPVPLSGSVYLTGPYEGAPFGLSIIVPAKLGPFDLGEIAIRARVAVDPRTAALSITSDPLPQSLDGIPLQLRTIQLNIAREGFIFNPTDCHPTALAGTFAAATGATSSASARFQAANCAALAFKPKLTALTHAHASKASGVHLHVRIVMPHGGADLQKLNLRLPKRIATRLTTLQKACPEAVFAADPARCARSSVVGTATVLTPLLHEPLGGPAYVVSRGHAATPEIGLALRSEGLLIEVLGQARAKGGVLSVDFGSLPDVPFAEVDVTLAAGPHSLLAANLPTKAHDSICGQRLQMPSEVTGQNGAVVKQSTVISVSGCHRARRTHREGGR